MASFAAFFRSFGFEECGDEGVETGFEKIALYGDEYGRFTHAARQTSSGKWTSKLGPDEDIEHALEGLQGKYAGTPKLFLKRPL